VIEGEEGNVGGSYHSQRIRIRIDVELPVEDVAYVARHELCHALDFQTSLADGPQDALDAYAERLYDPEVGGLPWEEDARYRRSEAVARICEVGPVVAAAIAEPCPGELPLLASLGSFAMTEIWAGLPAGPQPELGEPTTTSFQIGSFVSLSLDPTTDPEIVRLVTSDAADHETTDHVDVRTGDRVESAPEPVPTVAEGIVFGPTLERVVPFRAAGWPDRVLVAAWFDIRGFAFGRAEYPEERLLWSDGTGWSAVPVCLPGSPISEEDDPMPWDIFPAQDQVWYAEGDGQEVGWSPVTDGSR
jgi:hypothetical protein